MRRLSSQHPGLLQGGVNTKESSTVHERLGASGMNRSLQTGGSALARTCHPTLDLTLLKQCWDRPRLLKAKTLLDTPNRQTKETSLTNLDT